MFQNSQYILAKCSYGQKRRGVDKGPEVLFNAIKSRGQKGKVYNPKTVTNKEFQNNHEGYKKLYSIVSESLMKNNVPLILGGDHSIALATVPAVFNKYREKVKVVWFDAHADINTRESSPSGNLHGMPLAFVFNLETPIINIDYKPSWDQLIYIGLRSIDPFEKKLIKEKGITCYTSEDINLYGMDKIMEEV